VFGVTGTASECLNYAIQNRAEWKARGECLVAEMLEDHNNNDTVAVDLNSRNKDGNEDLRRRGRRPSRDFEEEGAVAKEL